MLAIQATTENKSELSDHGPSWRIVTLAYLHLRNTLTYLLTYLHIVCLAILAIPQNVRRSVERRRGTLSAKIYDRDNVRCDVVARAAHGNYRTSACHAIQTHLS